LVEAVAATEGASHIWHFVVGAIEHFGLGGGKRMPLTDVEIASPQAVNVAIERLKTFVFELKQELSATTRANKWWGNYDVDWLLWDQLQKHHRLIYQFDPIKWDTSAGDPPMYLWLGIENDAFVIGVEARYNLAEPDLTRALGTSALKALTLAGWSQGPNNNELRIAHENTVGVGESDLLTWALGRISEVESSGAFEKMHAACTKERVG
jgi:hypothetical protein